MLLMFTGALIFLIGMIFGGVFVILAAAGRRGDLDG